MPYCHTNEGIEICFVMKEALPIGEEVTQVFLPLGRGVDNFTGAVIRELCPWRSADIHIHTF